MRAVRIFLRLVTLVLSLSLVVFILVAGFWYVWQDARGRAPEVGYAVTATRLGRAAVGAYLRTRSSDVNSPANPMDDRDYVFVVESGDSVYKVAQNLERMGIISDASLFRRIVQYLEVDEDIEAGVYALRANMTMEEIAARVAAWSHGLYHRDDPRRMEGRGDCALARGTGYRIRPRVYAVGGPGTG